MAGRVEAYIHSDSTTENKGVTVVKVICETDFAAKTDDFRQFARNVAQKAFGFSLMAGNWKELISEYPEIEDERKALEASLKESIRVDEILTAKV